MIFHHQNRHFLLKNRHVYTQNTDLHSEVGNCANVIFVEAEVGHRRHRQRDGRRPRRRCTIHHFWIHNSSYLIQNSSFLIQNSSFLPGAGWGVGAGGTGGGTGGKTVPLRAPVMHCAWSPHGTATGPSCLPCSQHPLAGCSVQVVHAENNPSWSTTKPIIFSTRSTTFSTKPMNVSTKPASKFSGRLTQRAAGVAAPRRVSDVSLVHVPGAVRPAEAVGDAGALQLGRGCERRQREEGQREEGRHACRLTTLLALRPATIKKTLD